MPSMAAASQPCINSKPKNGFPEKDQEEVATLPEGDPVPLLVGSGNRTALHTVDPGIRFHVCAV